jgi:hypothetical protein
MVFRLPPIEVKILCFFSLKKQRLKRKAGNAFFKNAKTFGSKKIA